MNFFNYCIHSMKYRIKTSDFFGFKQKRRISTWFVPTCWDQQSNGDYQSDNPLSCSIGRISFHNTEMCERERPNVDQSTLPQIWDESTCGCKTPSKQTPCLYCQNGDSVIAKNNCNNCECKNVAFFIGKLCETCSLRCHNQGIANLARNVCNCLRNGYSGTFCECHYIAFTLTFGSVPRIIFNTFAANPVSGGSCEIALHYMTP